MPRIALRPSRAVADLLRARRRALGMTLRDVERKSGEMGQVIPFTTLARIESGAAEPGVSRLHALLRLYHLPIQAAGDLLEVEALAGKVPAERDPQKLRQLGMAAWRSGNTSEALACLLALRRATAARREIASAHQESVLSFAVMAGKLGKHHLSHQLLDEILMDRPDPALLVAILVQQSGSWLALGAPEAALAYLGRAVAHVKRGAHVERGWVTHQRATIEIELRDYASAEVNLKRAGRAFRAAGRPYDEALTLCALARLHVVRGAFTSAIRAARRAINFASQRKFGRIKMLSSIQHARAYLFSGAPEPALVVLQSVLSDAVAASDNIGRFYAHFYLWKTYVALGVASRADLERQEAEYYLQYIDEASDETIELGGLANS